MKKRCNLCREIMWPDLQALDLGAILIDRRRQKSWRTWPCTQSPTEKSLRRRRKTTRQECLKRSVFSRVCSPFYTLQFGVRFRTHARDREKRKERRVTSTQNRCHNFARADERGQSRPPWPPPLIPLLSGWRHRGRHRESSYSLDARF
jgi:hypothetical protein